MKKWEDRELCGNCKSFTDNTCLRTHAFRDKSDREIIEEGVVRHIKCHFEKRKAEPATGDKGEKCRKCSYFESVGSSERILSWGRNGKQSEIGFCHKEVPSVYSSSQYINTPITVYAGNWCGEFKPKAPAASERSNI